MVPKTLNLRCQFRENERTVVSRKVSKNQRTLNELLIDDNVELCIADLNSYPLIKFLNKDLIFDYEDLTTTDINLIENNKEKDTDFIDLSLENYSWSVRTTNVFNRYNIRYLSDLQKYTDAELLKLKNFGALCLAEVRQFYKDHKISKHNHELNVSS